MSEPKFNVGDRVVDGEEPPNHGRIIAIDANNMSNLPVVALMQDIPESDYETARYYSEDGLCLAAVQVQGKPLHYQYPELNIYPIGKTPK